MSEDMSSKLSLPPITDEMVARAQFQRASGKSTREILEAALAVPHPGPTGASTEPTLEQIEQHARIWAIQTREITDEVIERLRDAFVDSVWEIGGDKLRADIQAALASPAPRLSFEDRAKKYARQFKAGRKAGTISDYAREDFMAGVEAALARPELIL